MGMIIGHGPPTPITEGPDFLREPAPQKLRGSMIVRPPGVSPPKLTNQEEKEDVAASERRDEIVPETQP